MSSDISINVESITKCYHVYDKPQDRLFQMLSFDRKIFYREFWALGKAQGESVNILLNFTQFFETRIEYRFQI
ncbi:hypothetical protein ACV1EE_23845, partial [Aeromonas hydrophila]